MRLRARKRSDLFECSDTRCTRIRLRSGREPMAAHVEARELEALPDQDVSEGRAGDGDSTAWYEELRNRYRPGVVDVLLIAESPPDPGAGPRRFFYAPQLTHDNLYRGVAQGPVRRRAGL